MDGDPGSGELGIEGTAAGQAEASFGEALRCEGIAASRVSAVAGAGPWTAQSVFLAPILQGWDFSYISYRATPALVIGRCSYVAEPALQLHPTSVCPRWPTHRPVAV